MTFDDIVQLLAEKFDESVILGTDKESSPPVIQVAPQHIAAVGLALHQHEQTYFDYFSCLTALDNGPEAGTMEVIYHLYSIPYHLSLGLKVMLVRNKEEEELPGLPSVSHIWRSADWHEREAYDLLGIRFTGHPDMRRILLPANWEHHPLRKDYTLQTYYHGIKVAY